MPRSDNPILKQSTFDWKAAVKYQKLCNFEIQLKEYSYLMATIHKKVPVILNRLGLEGLWFVQTLNDKEKEKCRTSM